MGRSANKSAGVRPIADYDIVDQVFDAGAIWTYHSNEGHSLTKASLHKAIEHGFIRNRRMKDDFAGERHCQKLAVTMSAFHPERTLGPNRRGGRHVRLASRRLGVVLDPPRDGEVPEGRGGSLSTRRMVLVASDPSTKFNMVPLPLPGRI